MRCGGKPGVTVKHPEIRVSVVAEARGDFRIVDYVTKALRKAGVPQEEIDQFCDEALAAAEKELLRICGEWVTVEIAQAFESSTRERR
jgi:hypothetical protein